MMGLSGPLAEQRALKRLKDAYMKGTSNEEILVFMAKAEWMLNTGHTSAEWDELPIGDVRIMTLHYQFSKLTDVEKMKAGVAGAFSGKKKGAN